MTSTNGVTAARGITYKIAEGRGWKAEGEDQKIGITGGHGGPPY